MMIMNGEKTLLLAGMLGMGMFALVGCGQDDDDLNEYDVSLDIFKRTSLTKCNAMGVEPESTQTIGGEAPNAYREVPTYDNECMLWAIVNIAISKGNGKVKVVKNDGTEKTERICADYTATEYYNYVSRCSKLFICIILHYFILKALS